MTREDNQMLGTASLTVDDTPSHVRTAAVRRIANSAHNADDLAWLLDALGLDPREGL